MTAQTMTEQAMAGDGTGEGGLGPLLANLDPAMAIVTAAAGDERAGCLVGFHAQCSIEPERYVVWLSKANRTYRIAMESSFLGVHFLGGDQHELAERFGGETGDDVDKFASLAWEPGPEGVPLLQACPNRFVARRHATLDEGSDHVCVVVIPEHVHYAGRFAPLRLSAVEDITPGHEPEEHAF